MHVFKIIFIFLICTNTYADFSKFTQERWSSTFDLKVGSHFTSGIPISEPKGTYQSVIEIQYLDRDFNIQKDCLLYRVPSEKLEGELKVVSVEPGEVCREKIFEPSKIKITNIFNFGFTLKKQTLELLIDTKKISYQLYNVVNENDYVLYDSGETKTVFPGIFVSFIKKSKGKKLINGDNCYDVDDQCREVQKNICHMCPGAISEVVSEKCPGKYRRYCRDHTCGEKGQAACIRGLKATAYSGPVCIPGSPVGFCQKPFKVFCENGELMCR
jgi:hypothetical protein